MKSCFSHTHKNHNIIVASHLFKFIISGIQRCLGYFFVYWKSHILLPDFVHSRNKIYINLYGDANSPLCSQEMRIDYIKIGYFGPLCSQEMRIDYIKLGYFHPFWQLKVLAYFQHKSGTTLMYP